jgi:hypothetical protein
MRLGVSSVQADLAEVGVLLVRRLCFPISQVWGLLERVLTDSIKLCTCKSCSSPYPRSDHGRRIERYRL